MTVVPPPAVSSISTVPRTAWTKPRATARPRPTPVPAWVAEALEGCEDLLPQGDRDTGAPVDDPEVDAVAEGAGLDADGLSGGDQRTALSITLATARSRSAGSASTGGRVSSRSEVDDRRPGGPGWPGRPRTTSSRPPAEASAAGPRPGAGSCRAGWSTSVISRSVSSTMVEPRTRPMSSADQCDVLLTQAARRPP